MRISDYRYVDNAARMASLGVMADDADISRRLTPYRALDDWAVIWEGVCERIDALGGGSIGSSMGGLADKQALDVMPLAWLNVFSSGRIECTRTAIESNFATAQGDFNDMGPLDTSRWADSYGFVSEQCGEKDRLLRYYELLGLDDPNGVQDPGIMLNYRQAKVRSNFLWQNDAYSFYPLTAGTHNEGEIRFVIQGDSDIYGRVRIFGYEWDADDGETTHNPTYTLAMQKRVSSGCNPANDEWDALYLVFDLECTGRGWYWTDAQQTDSEMAERTVGALAVAKVTASGSPRSFAFSAAVDPSNWMPKIRAMCQLPTHNYYRRKWDVTIKKVHPILTINPRAVAARYFGPND